MTQITKSIRKPAGAIFLALALITTTFAGISSADNDEEDVFGWDWDSETGTVTIVPTPFLNTTTFSYEVHIDSYDSGTETWDALGIGIPTANVSHTTNLSDGYYMLSISVWNDYDSWYDEDYICMGLNCSETQVEISYNETTMIATLLVTGNTGNETITAYLFDEWTGNEQVLYNVSNGDTIDIGGQGDGYFCLELLAETADGFEIDHAEVCTQIGEEPVYPGMDAYYDDTTMMMTVDLYDMPDNSTFHYSATIESWDTDFVTWDNGTIDSNTTSIGFDIDEILSNNNQSYGIYWAFMEIVDTEGNYVVDGGTEFCYGDQTDCEEVEEMFICDNGEEIPMSWYDDGEADCEDGSDEPNGTGSEDTFICDDGEEIPMDYYDDGYADCEDGSDEPNGTEAEEEMELVSHDMDIWFEQWDDETMEFVMVSRMVIDDSESIALYAMMADMYLGNDDGEVSQDEVDLFVEMMSSEMDDEGANEAMMQLDGAPGTMVDTWMEIEGLVGIDESNVNESEIVMIMAEVVAFDTTAYADSTTHVFTIEDDDYDDDSSEEPVPDEGCDIDSIWIHNSDTWSVSSITDSASTMAFTYEDFNNAWFTEDCPDDSGTVTFNLVKTDGGELPDDTAEDDWGEIDMNKFPICAYAYAMMLPDGEFDVRMGIGAAPESGDYIIDLVDGAEYMISVVCSDPEGDDMTVTINNADLNLTSTYTSTAIAEASLLLSVPAGYDGTYIFDVTWTDGHHNEAGTLTVNGLGDGSGGDLSADGDGFLPGFTAALGIVALLGAAMIGSRRNRA
jgi:PGF-CTERM protein